MPALGGIACVTIATPDIDRSLQLYRAHLGYLPTAHGVLGVELARLWGKPNLAERRTAVLYPQGTGPTAIRFVASPAAPRLKSWCRTLTPWRAI
jgi:catechol 2,3-dioxygenase-like lactoylglutathione lyase family enzyme